MSSQRGMTMVVGLIMLGLLTLMAITSFKIGRTSLEIVGNMQRRNEGIAAAKNAIEEAKSTTRLFNSPATVFLNPCGGTQNSRCIDASGNLTTSQSAAVMTVTLTPAPTCIQAQPILLANVDLASQQGCIRDPGNDFGLGVVNANSLCANSVWEVRAVARDLASETEVVVTEGLSISVPTTAIETSCP